MASNTFQSNIHEYKRADITKYALFLGGLNVTQSSLHQYDPLKTGFGRIFMIRTPLFVNRLIPDKMQWFKHVLEYANTGVSGINNIQVNFNQLQGGYTNKAMDIPSIATDDTNEITIKTYEFSGSLMRDVIQFWINGVSDLQSGFSHYYGCNLDVCQANHTAEFIYVVTDQTGARIEYACLFANCFPKEVKLDHFNYDAGQHDLVPMDISFTATRYMSPQINKAAAELIKKYNILMNSLNFNCGYSGPEANDGTYYNTATGFLDPLVNVGDGYNPQRSYDVNDGTKFADSDNSLYKKNWMESAASSANK